MKRLARLLLATSLLALVLAPALAAAAPRSGGSFSGRGGFRSSGSSASRGYSPSSRTRGSGGPSVVISPSFWGFGPFGMGGGGSMLGTLLMLGVLGFGGAMLYRAVRRSV